MEMKDRIRMLLDAEKINSAKFAEIIGVQRSSISHILTGRNNPSFDIIQRIAEKFPKINLEWLITGKGNMLKTPVQRSLFNTDDFTNSNAGNANFQSDIKEISKNTNVNLADVTSSNKAVHSEIASTQKNIDELKVERIVIFYSDRTFVEYRPS